MKLNLTVGQIQGHLQQLLESDNKFTAEQRYSIKASIESMQLMKRISPGLKKAMDEYRKGMTTAKV